MRKTSLLSALLLLFTHCCDAEYMAAVVEYNPVITTTPMITIEENINNYAYQIEMAKGFGIIVFPEYGLTGLISDPTGYGLEVPNVGTSDFSNSSLYFLLRLSSAAKEHNVHVVVNLIEQTTNTTSNETLYYNTNLVFSNNGTLIAKYRKINLIEEPKLTPGTDIVTFTTDFGVFGLMTCADILYYNPSQTMLMNTGVTDVIYPSSWTSYLPFYVSLEVQVGYALANKVNLLASNRNNPLNGTGGSGIFSADGTALRTILTDTPATNFISANVLPPTSVRGSFSLMGFDILDNNTNSRQELAGFKNLTYFKYDSYVYKSLVLSQGNNITEQICHGKFCCNFDIVTWQNETNSSEVYKLVAYNGKDDYNTKQVSVKHCNLVACLTDDISTCGVRPSTPYTTRFRQILVWGNFENQTEAYFRPSSLGGNLQPIYNVTYLVSQTDESYGISFNTTQPVTNVVLFGLYGQSGAETLGVSLLFIAIIVAFKGIF